MALRDLVIQSQLVAPRHRRGILQRPRIQARLSSALDYPLTLVLAGTGYGKTTALSGLADLVDPLFWYVITEPDRDPLLFLVNLISAFHHRNDATPSTNWPTVAPGVLGPVNAWSLKYHPHDAADMIQAAVKPPVLWVRGSHDMIVADNSMFDIAALGKLGYVPGWPGDEIAPPQPMIQQTRDVLTKYAANGGSFEEHVIQNTAHSPHIEKPVEFNALFQAFLHKAG